MYARVLDVWTSGGSLGRGITLEETASGHYAVPSRCRMMSILTSRIVFFSHAKTRSVSNCGRHHVISLYCIDFAVKGLLSQPYLLPKTACQTSFTMSRLPGRGNPSLIVFAQAPPPPFTSPAAAPASRQLIHLSNTTSTLAHGTPTKTLPAIAVPMTQSSSQTVSDASSRTPTLPDTNPGSRAQSSTPITPVEKMKFKPKQPIRRVRQ